MAAVWPLLMSSTDKIVLLALADAANDEDAHTWIAVKSKEKLRRDGKLKLNLIVKTSLSERGIQNAITRLVEAGHISREERPGKGVDYWIHPVLTPAPAAPLSDGPPQEVRGTPAGGAPKSSTTPIRDRGVTRATDFEKPDGIEDQPWKDFLVNRKGGGGRRGVPNTPTAHKKMMDDLARISAKTGLTFNQLIELAAAKGWQGIYEPKDDDYADARVSRPAAQYQEPSNPLVRAAIKREAGRRSGIDENLGGHSGSGAEHSGGSETGGGGIPDWLQ